jgi:hypothetical protein
MNDLIYLAEPPLLFRYEQAVEDPRDGLTLFGPLDKGSPYGIRAGVVGTKEGIRRFRTWVDKIQRPISGPDPDEYFQLSHPPFPGFEAAFRIPWSPEPALELTIADDELKSVYLAERHERVYKTVDIYANRIIDAIGKQDVGIDVWFVVVSEDVYKYCRPQSSVEMPLRIATSSHLSLTFARRLWTAKSLFPELNVDAEQYRFEPDFHNQLKARLLEQHAPIQLIRESTIAHHEFLNARGKPTRKLDSILSNVAWNISNAAFYKAGGRPWKIAKIRKGVCYIGLVFKQDRIEEDPRSACCAAQMFLDSGDGVVFKGAVGPWYSPEKRECHLSRQAARELVRLAVETYKQHTAEGDSEENKRPPAELFIHGRVRFDDEEWAGFQSAVDSSTSLVGVQIRYAKRVKLYRAGEFPVLRGLAFVQSDETAYLWTNGFTPRIQTYVGKEVPNPLLINVCRGKAPVEIVLSDIMALTKLNYNACKYASGLPVTLRFADAVGEILTAGPLKEKAPLPFKFYI